MHQKKDDSQLIWESLMSKTNHKQNTHLQKLWENDVKYIEQFLIDEGLMDKVKGAYQGAKDFASTKLLKPIMTFLAKIIANDPQTAEKAQAAAAKGPEALQQLASAEGDQSVVDQIEQTPAVESVESYKLTLNEMICDALVEEGIITTKHSQLIQEKHFASVCVEIYNEQSRTWDCPWQPVVNERNVPAGAPRKKSNNYGQVVDKINKLIAMSPNTERDIFSKLMKTNVKFANFVKKQANAAVTNQQQEPQAAQETPTENPTTGDQQQATPTTPDVSKPENPTETPTTDVAQQSTQQAPGPQSSISAQPGLLGKIWNFVKSNKGAISGAAALGIAAALTATGNPMASAYLTGALIGGVRGAIKGATSTEGGFVDKLKGAANQAGKDSMIGGGLAAAGAGMAGAVGDLAAGGADLAGGAGDAANAVEPTVGGDEFSEPTRPDAAELDQMQQDTKTGAWDPNQSVDPEANANADLPNPYDPANSANQANSADPSGGMKDQMTPPDEDEQLSNPTRPGEVRGIGADGQEYTRAEGEPAPGTEKKSFGQKFKDFFKPAQTQPGEPTAFQKMRMRR